MSLLFFHTFQRKLKQQKHSRTCKKYWSMKERVHSSIINLFHIGNWQHFSFHASPKSDSQLKVDEVQFILAATKAKKSYNNDKFQRKMRRMWSKNLIDFFREDKIIIQRWWQQELLRTFFHTYGSFFSWHISCLLSQQEQKHLKQCQLAATTALIFKYSPKK